MSCHNIGKGINTIVELILEKYDNEKISYDDTFELLLKSRNAINYCDGNVYEALACMDDRCGHCLSKKENLLESYHLPDDKEYLQDFLTEYCWHKLILNDKICLECLEKLIKQENKYFDKK